MSTYLLHEHGWMLNQHVRTSAYARALRQVIKPGDRVLDIGTGVGTFAVAACQSGAGRVWAVDPSDVIEVGRELAAANGFGDRIEFVHGLSTELSLADRVDVIVQEIHGVLPMSGASLGAVIDARTRLLAPHGTLIPRRETLWAAPVSSEELYAPHAAPWGSTDFGLDLTPVSDALRNCWIKRAVPPETLVGVPQTWATIDYETIASPHVRGRVEWTLAKAAVVHGLALWFDADLAEGVSFSNAPGQHGLPFGQAFFPYLEPVPVEGGERISVDLGAHLLDNDYVWSWVVSVYTADGSRRVRFEQSDFWNDAASPDLLKRLDADYVARPSEERRVDLVVLDGLERGLDADAIARALQAQFARRFNDDEAALERVLTIARSYRFELAGAQR